MGVKGPSEENESKLPDVFSSSPKNFPQEGFSEITKGKSIKIEKLVTTRGLSFMLQFETLSGENLVQENVREVPVAKRRRFDRNQMEYMEEVKPEWRKAHRGRSIGRGSWRLRQLCSKKLLLIFPR